MNTVFGETAPSNRIWTCNGLQSNCRMCNQDVEKNCYYVREYLGDTSSYDAHLFFCFHDFRREFYMIWDHICLLIDMFELWNKFFLRIISSLQYLCKVEWYFHIQIWILNLGILKLTKTCDSRNKHTNLAETT